jgi:hypothetical protein
MPVDPGRVDPDELMAAVRKKLPRPPKRGARRKG